MLTEREAMKEFLETYKCLPCLWDHSDKLYSNREAREQAYEILVDKYKAVSPHATVDLVKKKIENMRCAYKREYKKVLASRYKSDTGEPDHNPTLWYYNLLTFLHEKDDGRSEFEMLNPSKSFKHDDHDEESLNNSESKLLYEEMPSKKSKLDNSIYIFEKDEDHVHDRSIKMEDYGPAHDYEQEAESFGRTVGLQLKQLTQTQRTVAEKLISEVIFYGRLEKLNLTTSLVLDENY